jgi:hypothetical protein
MATAQEINFNFNEDQMRLKIRALEQELDQIYLGGGKSKIEKHHANGKLTARERIQLLLDPDKPSFELGALAILPPDSALSWPMTPPSKQELGFRSRARKTYVHKRSRWKINFRSYI